jgi:plastocyanin
MMIRPIAAATLVFLAVGLAIAADAKQDDDAGAQKVTIQNLKYNPPKLTIKPGETIVWTNKDNNDHTVTADDGSFTSENLGGGDKFRHTFEKKGKFPYHCKYHPRMKGVVLVAD